MFVDDLRCLLLSECLSSKLVKSLVDWGKKGEGSVWSEDGLRDLNGCLIIRIFVRREWFLVLNFYHSQPCP